MTTTTRRGRRPLRPPGPRPAQQPDPQATTKTLPKPDLKAPPRTDAKAAVKAPPKAPEKGPSKAAPKTTSGSPSKTRVADTGAARARVPATRAAARTPRAPFVLLILTLLGGALVSLLLLNTVLAKDAFTLTELEQSNKLLIQQRDALEGDIRREESPAILAQKARAYGMRPAVRPAFVDPQTGQIVGGTLRPVPHAAAAAAGAAGVVGVPGAVVPGDGIVGWTGGEPKAPGTGGSP